MKAIIISRELTKEEYKRLEKKQHSEKPLAVFYHPPFEYFQDFGAKPLPEISHERKSQINFQLFDLLLKYGNIKVEEKRTIKDLLSFEKTSIWYYHKFRVYFLIRNLTFEIEQYKSILEKYSSCELYTSSTIFSQQGILPDNCIVKFKKKHKKKDYISLMCFLIVFLLRLVQSTSQSFKYKSKKYVIVDNRDHYVSMLDLNTLQKGYENNFMGYLYQKIDENFLLLDGFTLPKFDKTKKFRIKRKYFKNYNHRNRLNVEIILLRAAFSTKTWRKIKRIDNQLKENYKKLNSIEPLKQHEKILGTYLKNLHKSSMYYAFRIIAFDRFFKKNNFKSITTVDEYSPTYKSILDAAKKNDITTFGIQHGSMHGLHPGYTYTKEDCQYMPMPDITFLWGEKWKKYLAEQGQYPPDKVKVVGQVRTDLIPALKKAQLNIENILGNIFKNKKIVTFASQPQRDEKLRYLAAQDMFNAVAKQPEVVLALKLHPRETDQDYYHNIAKEAGCKNYKIFYNIDLFLLLSLSDIVVTCFSTVGTEAIYFRKPLIILDHLQQDILNYHKEGVAFQATNSNELKAIIEKIVDNKLTINDDAYNRFIKAYAFQIDGKVSERLLKEIKN